MYFGGAYTYIGETATEDVDKVYGGDFATSACDAADTDQEVLVGNKTDLVDARVVSPDHGKQLAEDLGIEHIETSAKNSVKVTEVFEMLVRQIPRTGSEYKITVLGAGAVGKSSLCLRYVQDTFIEDYDPTIENSFTKFTKISGLKPADGATGKETKKAVTTEATCSGKVEEKTLKGEECMPVDLSQRKTFAGDLEGGRSSRGKKRGVMNRLSSLWRRSHPHSVQISQSLDSSPAIQATHASQARHGGVMSMPKADTNVVLIDLSCLADDPDIVTGDPVFCGQCTAALSSL